ncbi:MAG: 2-oxoglutarate dehydrogenase complex dihydrolipoyllysine-residue succinyltransferase [Pseudomonadota bacterium]
MSTEVKVPQLPESVADATLVAWHKKPGDAVRRDENLVDLETDKVVLEVPCPVDGVLKEIRQEDGATVESGDLIAIVEAGEVPAEAPKESAAEPAASAPAEASPAAEAPKAAASAGKDSGKLSPSVRRLVEEHDLDPSRIKGSGRDGRITKADVMQHIDSDGDNVAEDASTPSIAVAGATRNERRVPMTRLRATIAKRMVEAQHNAAMLTTFNEVDLTEVIALRTRYKESFADAHGVKLGFMSFFVRAAVEALRKFPLVNASIDGNDIVYHDYHDIGIAVSTERGLLVPVLRDAGLMSFAEIEKGIADYGRKAREGTIGIDDLTGGTFTITNGGIFGSMMSTPILNPPQSGILGMHSIMDRPVVVNGQVEIRKMMYLAMSYDHRIIDGKEAVQFVVTIKNALEDPGRLLLQV